MSCKLIQTITVNLAIPTTRLCVCVYYAHLSIFTDVFVFVFYVCDAESVDVHICQQISTAIAHNSFALLCTGLHVSKYLLQHFSNLHVSICPFQLHNMFYHPCVGYCRLNSRERSTLQVFCSKHSLLSNSLILRPQFNQF